MKKTLAATLIACSALVACGQGTVAFSNGALTRISSEVPGFGGPVAITNGSYDFGLFYGIGQSTSLTLLTSQFGVSSTTGVGLIASPADSKSALTTVGIPGTTPFETDVWIQMECWSAAYGTD